MSKINSLGLKNFNIVYATEGLTITQYNCPKYKVGFKNLPAGKFSEIFLTYSTYSNEDVLIISDTDDNVPLPMQVKLEKRTYEDDFDIKVSLSSHTAMDVRLFLNKFGIKIPHLIGDAQLSEAKDALRMFRLHSPVISGVFSPGEGFELVVSAKQPFYGSSDVFVVVQDFKKSTRGVGETGLLFDKPIAAIIGLFKGSQANVHDIVYSIMQKEIPELNLLETVNKVALTVATNDIFVINNKKIQGELQNFVPAKGLQFIVKGVHILHYASNSHTETKDEGGKVSHNIFHYR